jgi:hypothetical protein
MEWQDVDNFRDTAPFQKGVLAQQGCLVNQIHRAPCLTVKTEYGRMPTMEKQLEVDKLGRRWWRGLNAHSTHLG